MAELTPKTKGPEVLAKGRGTCRRCHNPIRAGEDYIAKVDGVGWMHALCATEYVRVVNEHLDDQDDQAVAERELADVRARQGRQICRRLEELDFPPAAIEPLERHVRELERQAA